MIAFIHKARHGFPAEAGHAGFPTRRVKQSHMTGSLCFTRLRAMPAFAGLGTAPFNCTPYSYHDDWYCAIGKLTSQNYPLFACF